MPKLSKALDRLTESPISTMFVRAAELRAQGREIIDLTFGEPDFHTPEHAAEAGIDAIRQGQTKYTANAGTLDMKKAIQLKFQRDYGLEFPLDQVLSGPGAKGLLFSALLAILNADDEVIVPTPNYPVFEGMPNVVGARVVHIRCPAENGFKMTPEALEEAITPRTRLLIINSPNNPTGAYYERDELAALAEVLIRHPDVWVISDDVYEDILFDGRTFVNIAMVAPELADQIIILNGISKGYAMTGWRVGYMAGPSHLIEAVEAVISQTSSAAPTMSQVAAIAAMTGPQDYLRERAARFQGRRDLALDKINAIDGLHFAPPSGGIFAFVSVSDLCGKRLPDGSELTGSTQFSMFLLDAVGLATVPGSGFSTDTHIRLSLGVPKTVLLPALIKLADAVSELA